MSMEGHDGPDEHVNVIQDSLQPITKEEPTNGGFDTKDASEHHALDQKPVGHAIEDDSIDVTAGTKPSSSDEGVTRASLDSVFEDKTNEQQLLRPYEPIAKTLEADKEYTVDSDTVHERTDVAGHSEPLASSTNLGAAHVAEDSLLTHTALEPETAPEVQGLTMPEDNDINAAEVVPADVAEVPSKLQALVDFVPQVHSLVVAEQHETAVTTLEEHPVEAQHLFAEADSHATQPTPADPDVHSLAAQLETPAVTSEAHPIEAQPVSVDAGFHAKKPAPTALEVPQTHPLVAEPETPSTMSEVYPIEAQPVTMDAYATVSAPTIPEEPQAHPLVAGAETPVTTSETHLVEAQYVSVEADSHATPSTAEVLQTPSLVAEHDTLATTSETHAIDAQSVSVDSDSHAAEPVPTTAEVPQTTPLAAEHDTLATTSEAHAIEAQPISVDTGSHATEPAPTAAEVPQTTPPATAHETPATISEAHAIEVQPVFVDSNSHATEPAPTTAEVPQTTPLAAEHETQATMLEAHAIEAQPLSVDSNSHATEPAPTTAEVPQTTPLAAEPETPGTISEVHAIEAQPVSVESASHVIEPPATAEGPQTHPLVAEHETPATTSEAPLISFEADPAPTTLENLVSAIEQPAAEVGSVHTEQPDAPSHQEGPDPATAETTEVLTLETPHEHEEAQISVQLAAALAEPETQSANVEALAADIEPSVLPVEPLDTLTPATTLVEGDKVTDVSDAQLHAVPAETQVVEQARADKTKLSPKVPTEEVPSAETGSTIVDPEIHEADPAVVHSAGSLTNVGQEATAADLLAIEKGEEVQRPKSPWTPSYSVTTQGPGETAVVENVVEPVGEDTRFPRRESTPEIVVGHVDAAEPTSEPDNTTVSQADAEAAQGDGVEVQTRQREPVEVEEFAAKSQPSPLTAATITLSPGCEEPAEERPKSPWTPSYSVTTQGSATHETADLDELDQLPPRAIETVEQPTNSDVNEAAPVENIELVAVDALVDADHGDEMSQNHPADVAAVNIAVDDPLPDVPVAHAVAVVPQEDEMPVLTVSSSSVDDIAPQLTVDTSPRELGGEEDPRPKSPWTPSYSVTSQGSAHEPVEAEDVEEIPSSTIEPIDQPDVITALASIPGATLKGGQIAHEDLQASPVAVPSIDITESKGLSRVPSVHDNIEVDQMEDIAASAQLQPSAGEEALKSPSQLVVSTPPNVDDHEDRPKSPWTPSYAVTIQGTVVQDSADLDQLEQLPLSAAKPMDKPAVTQTEVTTAHSIPLTREIEADEQTDGPPSGEVAAQSASQLEGALLDELQATKDGEPEATASMLEKPANISLVLPENNVVENQPASPWTPSYSVTTQGPGVSAEQESSLHQDELNQLDQLSERGSNSEAVLSVTLDDIENISASSNVPEPPHTPQSELGIFTPGFDTRSEVSAASREPASPTSSRTDLASSGVDLEEPSTSIPIAVGTLADSVLAHEQDDGTIQSTPLATRKDVPDAIAGEEIVQESTPVQAFKSVSEDAGNPNVPHIFPSSTNEESPRTIQEKPSLLRLTSPYEDESSDRPLLSFEMPSSATSRKRLESAASSRFFPGGWFSSSPTVPEVSRTRTSLDVASGEFIRSPSTESRPSVETSASEVTSTPSAADVEDAEKKARWCTIM